MKTQFTKRVRFYLTITENYSGRRSLMLFGEGGGWSRFNFYINAGTGEKQATFTPPSHTKHNEKTPYLLPPPPSCTTLKGGPVTEGEERG
jgi:hypothetical protein